MQFQFLGCGDAFGTGGRFNTCFCVTHDVGRYLIDFGASSLIAMRKLSIDPNSIDTIFLTHLHADHFGGLPSLILDCQFYSRREKKLTIAGPPGLKDRLQNLREELFPGSTSKEPKFELELIEYQVGNSQTVNGITLTPLEVSHHSGAPSCGVRLEHEGRIIAYTGDSAWTEVLADLARDADLFICECYGYENPIPGHLSYNEILTHKDEFKAKRLVLTHMGPETYANRASLKFEGAEDGLVIDL